MNTGDAAPAVLLLNTGSSFAQAVAEGLERAGYRPCHSDRADARAANELVSSAVLFPWHAPEDTLENMDIEAFVEGLEPMLIDAGVNLRKSGLYPDTARLKRLVVLSGWEAHGRAGRASMSAVAGAMLGLARSWALEFAPLGMTVNAVVPGPDFMLSDDAPPNSSARIDDLVYAVDFFLKPRGQSISGQVLAVCGGRTPATIPV